MARTTCVNREELAEMYRSGMSQRDIANALGINQTTVSYNLRKFGICAGRGQGMGKGGIVARTIPEKDFKVADTPEKEKQEMAVKNTTNACLVVEDRSFSLKGVVGSYEVSAKSKIVLASIGDRVLELDVDILAPLADELKALARNLAGMEICNEMW